MHAWELWKFRNGKQTINLYPLNEDNTHFSGLISFTKCGSFGGEPAE
jgi:hypothetical protein